MHLKVTLPTKILVDQPVIKVIAEAENGAFCLLPRHVDYVTALAPGILMFDSPEGQTHVLAVDSGLLVKQGDGVLVATRHAIQGEDLQSLRELVDQQFRILDDQERQTRSSLAKLEASMARLFLNLS
ncbi:MAG: F0F1 ATP synthase subunit epsilon [Leptolyngbya sp. DLM2.Bin15]|nr:MAG: F0F1 ATP synthase subunit epsilon [Leptolyngbya sp. DLM2.Bin15]